MEVKVLEASIFFSSLGMLKAKFDEIVSDSLTLSL